MVVRVSLAGVTPIELAPGAKVVLRGLVTTSIDGSTFDATMQWGGLSADDPRPEGLFDLAAGGLRLLESHPRRHEYVVASTDAPGPACAAVGAQSPCLAPRLAELAHERLRTEGELLSTLSGAVESEGPLPPPTGAVAVEIAAKLAPAAGAVAVAVFLGLLLVLLRRRARGSLGRVRAAANEATRATRGDATLDALRLQVRALVARAGQLEVTRRACARKLNRLDRAALERRAQACAASSAPALETAEALAWMEAERAEAARLESELASSLVGLERIESALRVVSLRARRARAGGGALARQATEGGHAADPVDAVALELALRDEGIAEVDRVC